MITRRAILALLAAATIGSGVEAAHAADKVRVGWVRGPNDITLAKARGTLDKALAEKGIGVEWSGPFPAAAPAFEALNAGSIDITAGSSTAVVAALAARIPLAIFGYQRMAAGSEGILVKKESSIASVKDLAGRKVAVNRGGTGEYLLLQAFATNGVDPARVERVYLSPSDSGPSFLRDHVDAWATWDPFIAIAEDSYGARVLADGDAIGSRNAVVLVASRDFAASDGEALQAVFDVLKTENAWAVAHPREAGAIWAEAMNVPAALGAKIGRDNAVPTTPVSDAEIGEFGTVADWYAANGIVPTRPDIASSIVRLR